MKYKILKQYHNKLLYDLIDNEGHLLIGNAIYEGVINDIPKLMADKIIPAFEAASKEAPHFETMEVTDVDRMILEEKTIIKDKSISVILEAKTPTQDVVVAALSEHDENLVRYLMKVYQSVSYDKGYIDTNTWEAYVADIKTETLEVLLERK